MNKVKPGIFSVLFLFFHFQCNSVSWYSEEGFRWKRLSPKGIPSGLKKISGDLTGIEFQNFVSKENIAKNRHLLNGAGVTTGDVDGDGLTDVYFCRTDGPNVLYRNLGGWKFEDIT